MRNAMASKIIFPSLHNPEKHGYCAYQGEDNRESGRSYCNLGGWTGMFDTYGDGSVQHSPDRAVPLTWFADYLSSLAVYLADHPDDVALVAKHWPRLIERTLIHFLHSVRHKPYMEGKPRKEQYYSIQERKVSTSDNKRHDKRWQAVPDGVAGTVKDCCYLLYNNGESWRDSLQLYALYSQVHDELTGCGMLEYSPTLFVLLGWKDHVTGSEWVAGAAFRTVNEMVNAYRSQVEAERVLDYLKDAAEKIRAEKAVAFELPENDAPLTIAS